MLQEFFRGTPGAVPFGGAALTGSWPTPRFLEVFDQDVVYAQKATSCEMLIKDPINNVMFVMSAQDLLNVASGILFGRSYDFPPPHGSMGCG